MPRAKLDASYDAGILTVRLRNIGQTPLVVDKEMVFLLNLRVTGAEGTDLTLAEKSLVARPSRDFKNRFVSIKPGDKVVRTIDLRKGFTLFRGGIGSSMSESGPRPIAITAYEAVLSLPEGADPMTIYVSYRRGFGFPECFRRYTGLEANQLGLYEGPLQAVVKTK